ncbi:MAG: zinc dependent phospholipase C family protein [Spirochaetales bacterium]|nr:zinc dependent phospholipase C family protein [Leptospiraceae bacterium]MCP5482754.1 zinc dependent phospholipase C family protein [Spirochaetales bacterium]MCP5485248.1 zinc dependent phospholipase C family protein [Spirochaetales bacterium]
MAGRQTHIEGLKQALHHLEHSGGRGDAGRALARKLRDPDLSGFASLGAIAPDLFYFYHILSSRNSSGLYWGNLAHHERVCELLLAFLDHIRADSDGHHRDKCLAFAMGYLTHCAVDIVTHPYIFYITGDYYSSDPEQAARAQNDHLRVENILDAYLVHQRWGMSAREYDFRQHIENTWEEDDSGDRRLDTDVWRMWVRSLAATFPEAFDSDYVGAADRLEEGDILNEAYLGFLRFASWTDVRSWTVRQLLRSVDLLTLRRVKARNLILPLPHRIDRRLPNEEHRTWRYPADPERTSSESYVELVHRAARLGADMIRDALGYIAGDRRRKDFEGSYSGYNLDTGLRSRSLAMRAFEPIPEDPDT